MPSWFEEGSPTVRLCLWFLAVSTATKLELVALADCTVISPMRRKAWKARQNIALYKALWCFPVTVKSRAPNSFLSMGLSMGILRSNCLPSLWHADNNFWTKKVVVGSLPPCSLCLYPVADVCDDTVAGEYLALWICGINNASTDAEIGTVSESPWVLGIFQTWTSSVCMQLRYLGLKLKPVVLRHAWSARQCWERGDADRKGTGFGANAWNLSTCRRDRESAKLLFMSGMWTARKRMLWRKRKY